jgi:anti-sigma factor RsiW
MQELLHAYVDGELDLVHTLEVERHLQDCPACARACSELRELCAALRARLPHYPLPAGLSGRIRAALRQQDRLGFGRRTPKRWRMVAVAASVALLVAGVAVGLLSFSWRGPSAQDRLVQEVVDSHVRSQLASRHLLDMESSDRHVLKPWFQGKLDFAPTVRDLKDDGFILAGGRLDYVNGRPVAALVYHRRRHVINLLTWPAAPGERETNARRSDTRQGYHLLSWRHQGMNWWAVSDLNEGELAEFARLLRGRD